MKKAFTLHGYGKGKIESKVYKRPPKGCPKCDIIRLTCTHQDGHNFADFFVYPEEAMMIASVLMRAWSMSYQYGVERINPDNCKDYKPFSNTTNKPNQNNSQLSQVNRNLREEGNMEGKND